MATIDDAFRFTTWWGIGDAWKAKTTYNSADSDNNRFYVGGSSTRGRTRLSFTIPTSYSNPTSLIIGLRPDSEATISYMRALLTTNGNLDSNADNWASASILATSYFYSDSACTTRITGVTSTWVYCKFDYKFTPGTTYYVGMFPYSSSTSIGNTDYPAVWFRGKNMADYIWSRMEYAAAVTNTIHHWLWGFTQGGGNNSNKTAYKLGVTNFSADQGSSFTLDINYATKIPKGCFLKEFNTSSISGTWQTYYIGTSVTQKSSSMSFEYDYYPWDWTISYTMNGGTNNSSNPSSYNTLRGVTFANPSRNGYTFNNWTINGSVVTGINPGATEIFSSASDLISQLSSRVSGDKTVVANWTANTYTIKYNGNGNTSGSTASSTHTYDSSKALTTNGFTKTGYAFQGWATSASGPVVYTNGQSVKNLTSTNGAVINLYAVWVESLIRDDILPHIRIGSTNQPMMPRIFYNGAWHWYLMNIKRN